jgi:hypothetical protein
MPLLSDTDREGAQWVPRGHYRQDEPTAYVARLLDFQPSLDSGPTCGPPRVS